MAVEAKPQVTATQWVPIYLYMAPRGSNGAGGLADLGFYHSEKLLPWQ